MIKVRSNESDETPFVKLSNLSKENKRNTSRFMDLQWLLIGCGFVIRVTSGLCPKILQN